MVYCELCGNPIIDGKAHKVLIDNAILTVCDNCFNKLSKKKADQTSVKESSTPASQIRGVAQPKSSQDSKALKESKKRTTIAYERYELVEDYAERIRRARESLGWSQSVLAVKAKVGENIIKRIESGKLRPSFDLAKRLEEILNIRLLVPVVEEEIKESKSVSKEVTLGEIVNIRE
ncbi:MAG: multiprotein bridging factor aMBF1 [Ignisphaera sp.]